MECQLAYVEKKIKLHKEESQNYIHLQEGAGHFAYLEHNQAFLRIAKNFLLEGRA